MSDDNKIRLAVGLPSYGGRVSTEHCRMWLEMGHTLACSERRFEFKHFEYVDVCGIERARNALVAKAMVEGASWLLMIDSDTWVEGGADGAGVALLRMISEAQKAGAALVGAPVVRRRLQHEPGSFLVYKNGPDGKPFAAVITKQLFEIDAIGAACIAMDLEKIGNAVFRFTDALSEDLEFCRQIREAGGKIMCDGRVQTAHLSRPFPLLSSELRP